MQTKRPDFDSLSQTGTIDLVQQESRLSRFDFPPLAWFTPVLLELTIYYRFVSGASRSGVTDRSLFGIRLCVFGKPSIRLKRVRCLGSKSRLPRPRGLCSRSCPTDVLFCNFRFYLALFAQFDLTTLLLRSATPHLRSSEQACERHRHSHCIGPEEREEKNIHLSCGQVGGGICAGVRIREPRKLIALKSFGWIALEGDIAVKLPSVFVESFLMPAHPNLLAADPSNNLRDHGILYHKDKMDTLSRPLLLSSSNVSYLPISVRDSDLYQYASSNTRRHETSVTFARTGIHEHPVENGQDNDAESSLEETSLLQDGRPTTADLGLVPFSNEELERSSSDLPSDSYMSPASPDSVQDSVEPLEEYSPLHDHNYCCRFPQPCDSTLAQMPHTDSPSSDVSFETEPDVVEPEFNSSDEVPPVPPSQSSANSEDVPPSIEEPPPNECFAPRIVDLDSRTLTALLKELTTDELDIFDNLMDSIVDTQTSQLVFDTMTDGHVPVEPTHTEIDAMTGTWEDLFQNPYEYMLHTPDKCPNCGRLIALSRLAPHMISSCGQKRSAADRKKRTTGRRGRQTRSQVGAVDTPEPSSSSNLATEGNTEQSSQGSLFEPADLKLLEAARSSRAPPVADAKRMAGLEDTILRLKKRVKKEDDGLAEPPAKRLSEDPSGIVCLD